VRRFAGGFRLKRGNQVLPAIADAVGAADPRERLARQWVPSPLLGKNANAYFRPGADRR
jgi:hypothetical protein